MPIFRFYKLGIAGASALILISILYILKTSPWIQKHTPSLSPQTLSIWQGYTSIDQTVISVLSPKEQKLSYFVEDDASPQKQVHPAGNFQKPYSEWKTEHLRIQGLKPDKAYTLKVQNNSSQIIAQRQFKTLDLAQKSFTIAVASCMDDYWSAKVQVQMWKDLLSFQPNMIFLIGDNVYADKNIPAPSMKNFHKRYVETFSKLHLYKTSHLIPILAVWDDHDYGFNNGHKDFIYKSDMQKLFRGFFPLYPDQKNLISGKGVSFLLKTAGQNFFFMDDRSFRSPPNPQGRLWGIQQEEWLFQKLKKLQTPSWIINGGQFFGRHHPYESFEKDFPVNFQKFITRLGTTPSSVFFLSGDRHLTELLKIEDLPYTSFELTTSAIHAKVPPQRGDHDLDPRHIHHFPEKHNYAIIQTQGQSQNLKLNVQVYSQKKSLLFSEKLHIRKK